jgi:hypothetical protein
MGVCFFEMTMSLVIALQPRSVTGYRDAYIFGGRLHRGVLLLLLVNHRGRKQ